MWELDESIFSKMSQDKKNDNTWQMLLTLAGGVFVIIVIYLFCSYYDPTVDTSNKEVVTTTPTAETVVKPKPVKRKSELTGCDSFKQGAIAGHVWYCYIDDKPVIKIVKVTGTDHWGDLESQMKFFYKIENDKWGRGTWYMKLKNKNLVQSYQALIERLKEKY